MKKFVLAILAVSTIATANAQKGTILVYGNVGFQSMKDAAKTSHMSWNITPGIGYQFNNNWTAGLDLGYSLDSSMKMDGAKDRTNYSQYKLGAFLRYTKNLNQVFALYGQLGVDYKAGHTKTGSATSDKWTGFGANLTPAVAINIPKWFAMSFSVGGLEFNTQKYDGAPNSISKLDFTFGQQVNVGIYKNFGGGHHMHHKHMKDEDNDDSMAPSKHHHHHKSKKAKNDDDDDE